MITEQKIAAVKKQLRSGIPQGEIKNSLLSEGFSDEDIQKIFAPHKADMSSWYFVFAVIFLIGGFFIMAADIRFPFAYRGLSFLFFSAAMFYQYYQSIQKPKQNVNE